MSDYLAGLAPYVADYDYPWGIIVTLVIVGGLLCLLLLRRCGVALMTSFGRSLAFGVLAGYVALVLCYTVFLRPVSEVASGVHLVPFGKYADIWNKVDFPLDLIEVLLNIAFFIPIGFLLSASFGKLKWWEVALIGCFFSVTIEVLQLITSRGLCETDDVIHNTLGCIVGVMVWRVVSRIHKLIC